MDTSGDWPDLPTAEGMDWPAAESIEEIELPSKPAKPPRQGLGRGKSIENMVPSKKRKAPYIDHGFTSEEPDEDNDDDGEIVSEEEIPTIQAAAVVAAPKRSSNSRKSRLPDIKKLVTESLKSAGFKDISSANILYKPDTPAVTGEYFFKHIAGPDSLYVLYNKIIGQFQVRTGKTAGGKNVRYYQISKGGDTSRFIRLSDAVADYVSINSTNMQEATKVLSSLLAGAKSQTLTRADGKSILGKQSTTPQPDTEMEAVAPKKKVAPAQPPVKVKAHDPAPTPTPAKKSKIVVPVSSSEDEEDDDDEEEDDDEDAPAGPAPPSSSIRMDGATFDKLVATLHHIIVVRGSKKGGVSFST